MFQRRGHVQPWRAFLVSNCVFWSCLSHLCLILADFDWDVYFRKTLFRKSIFLSFSFLECADTSRNDLELESEWKRLPRAWSQCKQTYMMAELWTLEIMSYWSADKLFSIYILWTLSLKIHFQAQGHSFSLYGPTLSRLITCLSSLQVGLFAQLCHWIGLNAFYKPLFKKSNERTNSDTRQRKTWKRTEWCILNYFMILAFSSPVL